jgi:hypothetical protein
MSAPECTQIQTPHVQPLAHVDGGRCDFGVCSSYCCVCLTVEVSRVKAHLYIVSIIVAYPTANKSSIPSAPSEHFSLCL